MLEKLGVFKDHKDGSLKSVYKIDNRIIEMTLLFNREKKDVICVPTHHFCNLGCKMCHLTNNSLNKKMNPIKIDDFMEAFYSSLTNKGGNKITDKKGLVISFMGVGEPLLNYCLILNVYKHEAEIKKRLGYTDICYSLATMMPNRNLELLTNKVLEAGVPLKVHFSLHTPIDEKRNELIPSTKVTVLEAFELLNNYKNKVMNNDEIMNKYMKLHNSEIPIELHYTLIENNNDTEDDLRRLIELEKEYNIPIKFILFNPKENMKGSLKEDEWISKIKEEVPGIIVKKYAPPGKEVGSSCGEFTKHYYHEEIETEEELLEFQKWVKEHKVNL